MKLSFLFPLFFMMLSCLSAPEIYLKTNNAQYWKDMVKNKMSYDIYQNIYKFNNNANMTLNVYGYKSPIKYSLFLMKEKNQAFYYKNTTLKSYIIESLPTFNLYQDTVKKNVYDRLYSELSYYISKNFPDRSIYLSIGLMVKDDVLYIARNYTLDYTNRLRHWMRKNGYGRGGDWIPSVSADWESYPIPTEHEIDWDDIDVIGKLL